MSGVRLFLVLIAITAIATVLGNGRAVNLEWIAGCAVAVLVICGVAGHVWSFDELFDAVLA